MSVAAGSAKPRRSEMSADELYQHDLLAWTEDQAERLRALKPAGVDWENLAEEIESVGRSQKAEIRSRMVKLLSHLLEWEHQPERRCQSWLSTISEQRIHIEGLTETSPSLKRYPAEVIVRTYPNGVSEAQIETGRPATVFPEDCPYRIADVLDHQFFPGQPWHPDHLFGD